MEKYPAWKNSFKIMKLTGYTKSSSSNNNSIAEPKEDEAVSVPYTVSTEAVLVSLNSSVHGLSHSEAVLRIDKYGRNTLPKAKLPGIAVVFLNQFKSPLIYVLVAAAVLSVAIKEWSDAGFITAVLIINAVIGCIQEYSAQRAAVA